MTIGANSYGSVADVAGMVPRYADAGGDNFSTATRPTLSQVEGWINQISAILNGMLAEAGFVIPVTQTDVKAALGFFVIQEVASLAEGVNGSGRFGPTAKQPGNKGRFTVLVEDAQAYIQGNKAGFDRLGAARAYPLTAGLAFRDVDNAGDPTFPLVERKGFGNKDRDWDPPQ